MTKVKIEWDDYEEMLVDRFENGPFPKSPGTPAFEMFDTFVKYLHRRVAANVGYILDSPKTLVDNYCVNGQFIEIGDYDSRDDKYQRDIGETKRKWWNRVCRSAMFHNSKYACMRIQ
jgi:hypothetical protein